MQGNLKEVNELMESVFSILDRGKASQKELTIDEPEKLAELTEDTKKIHSVGRNINSLKALNDSEFTTIGLRFASKLKGIANGNQRPNQ
jgi:hypothetical protein